MAQLAENEQPPPTYQEAVEIAENSQCNASPDASLAVFQQSDDRADDGRINVDLKSRLSRTLYRILRPSPPYQEPSLPPAINSSTVRDDVFPIRLNIVLQVVGSRGDVQPFLALGTALRKCGHRIRLATHEKFRSFVENAGMDFYPIGGDPEDLMAYMVKNPGLIPSMRSLREGDIKRKRSMVAEILNGCWQSCIEPNAVDNAPFVADAIIANPPSFAHVHCAEALGIPLHMVFTMPWTSTGAYAHPLANIVESLGNPKLANRMSYALVEWMTWQGLGDIINSWRAKLDLEPVPVTEGPLLAETLKVPHTYCWSPAVVPKPLDWGEHIDISGFFFRETPDYKPSSDLQCFLDAGPAPVYIGFGSIVVQDVARFSSAIVEAIINCGKRAIISPGWSRLQVPEDRSDFFRLEECPHEWLFKYVSLVIHHGGAGTTAIGLREAKPTIVVPFFGDQPFWGKVVCNSGAGPPPIPQKEVDAEKLEQAIRFCDGDSVREAADRLSAQIKQEDGVGAAVRSFHANLPLDKLQCAVLPDQPASCQMKLGGNRVALSRTAAGVLIQDTGLKAKNLKPYPSNPIMIVNRRWDPATGTASSLIGTTTDIVDGATGIILKPHKEFRGRRQHAGRETQSAPGSASTSRSRPVSQTSKDDVIGDHDNSQSRASGSDPSTAPRDSTPQPPGPAEAGTSGAAIAGAMALASGKSAGKVIAAFYKGVLVDMPLATAEGFRAMPRLWGAEARDYGTVTDWRSGGVVAGRTLVQGVGDGFRDVVELPARGAREAGVWGAARGVAMGGGSLVSSVASAGVGLVAYPGQGIVRSLYALAHTATGRRVEEARREEGRWRAERLEAARRRAVVDKYHDLQRKN